jgi:transcription antitermination factor NusG
MSAIENADTAHWYAVHVRSRHEKMVATLMRNRDIKHWLPLRRRRSKWSDRYVDVEEPLFPGYIFANLRPESFLTVVSTRGVVRLVGSGSRPIAIPDNELGAVRTAIEAGLFYDPYPELVSGAEVSIVRGPLRGYSGVLTSRNGKHRVLLSIPLIGKAIAVEMDAADVKTAY